MNIARVVEAKPAGVAGLGMIPSWQFSMNPAVNPKINPHVQFPEGVYQTTAQPLGPWFNSGAQMSLRGAGLQGISTNPAVNAAWTIASIAGGAASAYHGYKRNDSIGWALWWGFWGSLLPIFTPIIAYAQGFGKKK